MMYMNISIDFGTSNSVVSIIENNSDIIKHIYDPITGSELIPTIIYFIQDEIDKNLDINKYEFEKHYFIGSKAKENYNIYKIDENYFNNFKRYLGLCVKSLKSEFDNIKKKYVVDEDYVYFYILDKNNEEIKISIEDIIYLFLNGLNKMMNMNEPKIYITAPTYFTDKQKSQLTECYKRAGFEIKKYYNEPTSGAIFFINKYYKDIEIGDKHFIVLDVGGGTTDVTVVKYDFENKICEIIDVDGDNSLGGIDLNNILINNIYTKYKIDKNNRKWYKKLLDYTEDIKIKLTFLEKYDVVLENVPINNEIKEILKIEYTRHEYNKLIDETIDKIYTMVKMMTEKYSIENIVLIGGTTITPLLIQKLNNIIINSFFEKNTLYKTIVADGACVMNKLIQNDNEFTLIDVVPMDIYIKVNNDEYITVIKKNSRLPLLRELTFTTSRDSQRNIEIEIYEGNNKINIANYTIYGIPVMKKGDLIVKINFTISNIGILSLKINGITNKNNTSSLYNFEKDIKLLTNSNIKKILKNLIKNKI